eukprot:6117184-Alexandrium_andersonii.AAC.1
MARVRRQRAGGPCVRTLCRAPSSSGGRPAPVASFAPIGTSDASRAGAMSPSLATTQTLAGWR